MTTRTPPWSPLSCRQSTRTCHQTPNPCGRSRRDGISKWTALRPSVDASKWRIRRERGAWVNVRRLHPLSYRLRRCPAASRRYQRAMRTEVAKAPTFPSPPRVANATRRSPKGSHGVARIMCFRKTRHQTAHGGPCVLLEGLRSGKSETATHRVSPPPGYSRHRSAREVERKTWTGGRLPLTCCLPTAS